VYKSLAILLATTTLGLPCAKGQPVADAAAHPFSITRSDPALDALISPHAELRTVATGFGFIDGPVWIAGRDGGAGFLLASSIIDNVIYKVTPAGKVSVYLDRAGYSGTDFANVGKLAQIGRAHVILLGPGCTGVDRAGRLIWCAGQDLAIKRLEKDGTRTLLADRYQGKRFNLPNDIAAKSDGAIYFTDTIWGMRGAEKSPDRELPYSGFFLIKDRKVTLLGEEKDSDTPNHALRCSGGRYGVESGEISGCRHRRHQGGPERQCLFDGAGQLDLDYVA